MTIDKYYASQPEGQYIIEAFKISHSLISQDYKFTSDTVDLVSDDNGTFTSERIAYTEQLDGGNLDKTATLSVNDFGDVIDSELDNIDVGNDEPILVTRYRYLDIDLSSAAEAISFEARTVSQSSGVATFQLAAPRLNVVTTGERFNFNEIPMLRGI